MSSRPADRQLSTQSPTLLCVCGGNAKFDMLEVRGEFPARLDRGKMEREAGTFEEI